MYNNCLLMNNNCNISQCNNNIVSIVHIFPRKITQYLRFIIKTKKTVLLILFFVVKSLRAQNNIINMRYKLL